MEQTENNKPEKTFKPGQVRAVIWKNRINKNNKEFDMFIITIARNYKTDGDKWKNTNSFLVNVIPRCNSYAERFSNF